MVLSSASGNANLKSFRGRFSVGYTYDARIIVEELRSPKRKSYLHTLEPRKRDIISCCDMSTACTPIPDAEAPKNWAIEAPTTSTPTPCHLHRSTHRHSPPPHPLRTSPVMPSGESGSPVAATAMAAPAAPAEF